MKLIRRLFRYFLVLLFIAVLFAAYYYRALIFSEYINTSVDNAIHSGLVMANIVPENADPDTTKAQEMPDCVPVEIEAQTADVIKAEVEITQTDSADPPENTQATDVEPERPVVEEQATVLGGDVTDDQLPAPAETVDQAAETVIEQPTDDKPESPPAEEEANIGTALESDPGEEGQEVTQKSHSELLNKARYVYQCGDVSNSIDLYRELGALYPDDPNVYGELGNVFYSKGDWKQASLAYYEAAVRLHKRHQQDQIHYLYRVIQGLDPETAEKLRSRLSS